MKHFSRLCLVFLSTVVVVSAESYVPLTQIPGFKEGAEAASAGDFSGFINNLYMMSIGACSVIAVFVIIYAGVRISSSDNVSIISELRSRVGMAIGGLVLLLGAYIFLEFINPDLTDFSPSGLGAVNFTNESYESGDTTTK